MHRGRKQSLVSIVCAPPPTAAQPAPLAKSRHPDPSAPQTLRVRPARTWGPAARGGAERTVQGQQAGQQRAERSHVAARERGPGRRRSPALRVADAAGARPGLLKRRPAGLCRRLLQPRRLPPSRSRSPARRRRLDSWLRAPEAGGGRAMQPTCHRPWCQLSAGSPAP